MKASVSAVPLDGAGLAAAQQRPRHWHAVGYLLATGACFATLDTLSKFVGDFSPAPQTLWMRYAVQALFMTVWWWVWLRPRLGTAFFRTSHPRFHIVRALLLITCTAISIVGLRHMPVGEFTAVALLSPMMAMVLSGWLLGEPLARAHAWFAGLAFVGAMIVMRPGQGVFGWAVLFPLALALVNALFHLLTRKLASADEHPVFSQWAVGTVGMVVLTIPLFWPGAWAGDLEPWQWGVLLTLGLFGTLGHFFLMKAFALETAPALAPYGYAQIVFAMLGGWMLFAHAPDRWAVVGMLVIGISGFASGLLRARGDAAVPAAARRRH